ncbi:MAG: glycosyltransferase, partial [Oscillospiraceae bacterium]|nr:glycosyltransferase [Oscillospiraceae bacterium]
MEHTRVALLNDNVKVSVVVLCYNQMRYIEQCIDSILCQKVNFKYEILIGDDASTDNTKDILMRYYEQYKDRIKLCIRETNIGASANALDLICAASGEYIAYLEGDDFWCDPNKLQKQCDFLDANPSYAACFHDIKLINEKGKLIHKRPYWISRKRIFRYKDFNGIIIPGHSSSWFRRNIIKSNKQEYARFIMINKDIADRSSALFFLAHGDFARIEGKMSCYRYNRSGTNITTQKYNDSLCALKNEISFLFSLIELSENLNRPRIFLKRKCELFFKAVFIWLKSNSLEARDIARRLYSESKSKPLMILSLFWEAFFT